MSVLWFAAPLLAVRGFCLGLHRGVTIREQQRVGRADTCADQSEICSRIERSIPITLTDLVTLVLLAANGRALDAGEIWRQASDIVALIERWRLPQADNLHLGNVDDLQTTLQAFEKCVGMMQEQG